MTALHDNADYDDGSGSVTKARAFVTAARRFLFLAPKRASHGGEFNEIDPAMVKDQLAEAQAWLAANDTSGTPSVSVLDFSEARV